MDYQNDVDICDKSVLSIECNPLSNTLMFAILIREVTSGMINAMIPFLL